MKTPPNHSLKSLTKAWLSAVLMTGLASFVSAQSFENDFGFGLSSEGDTLIFTESYEFSGFSRKYQYREHWRAKGDSESVLTVSVEEGGGWETVSSTYYKADGTYSTRIYSDYDYNENLLESSSEPDIIELGVSYWFYERVGHKERGDGDFYGTGRTDYTETLTHIDLIDTLFGRVPALRFEGSLVDVLEGDYYIPGTLKGEYTYWIIPGFGEVKATERYPEIGEAYSHELTDVSFDFEPEPLPILDGDNPVWNMFGYTWDMGNGWQESFEFGSLWSDSFPWVWSDDMQSWLYLEGDRKSLWAWVERTATWIWTNQATYPWVYDSVNLQWASVNDGG